MSLPRCTHALVASLALAASTGAGAATIAHWTFEEGTHGSVASGANSVLDTTGNHHGTPFGSNGPVYEAFAGGGTALRFDGIDDGVFTPGSDAEDFDSASLTVEALISLDSLQSGLRQIAFRGDGRAGADPFFLAVNNGRLHWRVEGPSTGGVSLVSPDLLPINQVLHVAGTIDDATGNMRLWIDGVLVNSIVTARRPTLSQFSSARVSLGSLDDGNGRGQFLDASIGAVRISDVALGANRFLGATSVPEPGTLALLALGLAGAVRGRAGSRLRPRTRGRAARRVG